MQQHNIFITGATGLLGRSILFELASKYNITALKRSSSIVDGLPQNIHWVTGDLALFESIEQEIKAVDVVIHAAAKVNFNPKQAQEIMAFNVDATKNIVDACLEHNKRLIHISSVAALGGLADLQINEDSAFDIEGVNTDYAKSKYFSEIEVWRGIAEGLDAVIINPSIILGIPSKFPESSGIFWKQIDNGLPVYPTGTTGFVDARDVAKIIYLLVDSEVSGERFVVSAENWSYQDFFSEIADSLDKKPPQKPLKKWQSSLLWRASALARQLGTKANYTKALHHTTRAPIHYQSNKVIDSLGITFRPVKESIKWVSTAYSQK